MRVVKPQDAACLEDFAIAVKELCNARVIHEADGNEELAISRMRGLTDNGAGPLPCARSSMAKESPRSLNDRDISSQADQAIVAWETAPAHRLGRRCAELS